MHETHAPGYMSVWMTLLFATMLVWCVSMRVWECVSVDVSVCVCVCVCLIE